MIIRIFWQISHQHFLPTSHFEFYTPGQSETVLPLRESQLYLDDFIGVLLDHFGIWEIFSSLRFAEPWRSREPHLFQCSWRLQCHLFTQLYPHAVDLEGRQKWVLWGAVAGTLRNGTRYFEGQFVMPPLQVSNLKVPTCTTPPSTGSHPPQARFRSKCPTVRCIFLSLLAQVTQRSTTLGLRNIFSHSSTTESLVEKSRKN